MGDERIIIPTATKTNSNNDNNNNTTIKSVNFCQVEIIELPIILGDNPSLSSGGPPMCCGWHPMRRSQFSLDFYEKHRPKRRANRRGLIITGAGRSNFFLKCGYSIKEIEEATRIAHQYKRQMTISKILSDAPPIDRFSSSNSSSSSFSSALPSSDTTGRDCLPTFRRKNSPTAEPATTATANNNSNNTPQGRGVVARVWSLGGGGGGGTTTTPSADDVSSSLHRHHYHQQALVQPRRISSPVSGTAGIRKSNKTHFGIGAHRPRPQRTRSDCAPPSQPSRVDSPTISVPVRKRPTTTQQHGLRGPDGPPPPGGSLSSSSGRTSNLLTRHQSMPTHLARSSTTSISRPRGDNYHHRHHHHHHPPSRDSNPAPPSRPDRTYSPTDVFRRKGGGRSSSLSLSSPSSLSSSAAAAGAATDKMSTESVSVEPLQMPLRKSSPILTMQKSSSSSHHHHHHHGASLPPPPPPSSSPSPAQPRRKRSPPIESQKTLRRCT